MSATRKTAFSRRLHPPFLTGAVPWRTCRQGRSSVCKRRRRDSSDQQHNSDQQTHDLFHGASFRCTIRTAGHLDLCLRSRVKCSKIERFKETAEKRKISSLGICQAGCKRVSGETDG